MSSDPHFQPVANSLPDAFENLCGVLDLSQRNIAYRMQGRGWIDLAGGVAFVQELCRHVAGSLGVRKATRSAITPLLRGWLAYFCLAEVRGRVADVDGRIRRKIRRTYGGVGGKGP